MQSEGIYGFQWRENGEFGRMVKSVGRKSITLWCFVWQVEERIKSKYKERVRLRETEGGREAWREVWKTDARRVGNWEEEAGNSEEDLWDKSRDCTWGEISKCKIAENDYTSGQTDTTNGQTDTTSEQTSTASGKTSTQSA